MILLAYNANYLTEPNMFTSLLYIADFMRSKKTLKDKVNDIPKLKGFDKATWSFLSSNF